MDEKDCIACERNRLFINALVKIEGMKAGNELARCYGDKPIYGEGCFDMVAREHAEAITRLME